MKRIWIAAALLVAVALIAGYSCYTVGRNLSRLQSICDELYAGADNKAEAAALSEKLADEWKTSQKIFSIWLAHDHVEEVNSEVNKIKYYAETGDADGIRVGCVSCTVFFNDMRHAQIPFPENIF